MSEIVGYAYLNTTLAEVLFREKFDEKMRPVYSKQQKITQLDKTLLLNILDLLEYITFHDGRYGQLESKKAYDKAYSLAKIITEKLGISMYADRERTL